MAVLGNQHNYFGVYDNATSEYGINQASTCINGDVELFCSNSVIVCRNDTHQWADDSCLQEKTDWVCQSQGEGYELPTNAASWNDGQQDCSYYCYEKYMNEMTNYTCRNWYQSIDTVIEPIRLQVGLDNAPTSSDTGTGSSESESESCKNRATPLRRVPELMRIGATVRERTRMHMLNDAFDELRKAVPKTSLGEDQKLSKIATLRMAIQYIAALVTTLQTSGVEIQTIQGSCVGDRRGKRRSKLVKKLLTK